MLFIISLSAIISTLKSPANCLAFLVALYLETSEALIFHLTSSYVLLQY